MAITISGAPGTYRLWNVQQAENGGSADVTAVSAFGMDSDETIIISLVAEERFTLTGTLPGKRLAQQSGYSSDPVQAMSEWVGGMEEFVDPKQGAGNTLDSDHHNTSLSGMVESFGWQRQHGEKFELQYDLEFVVGDPVSVTYDSTVSSGTPGGSYVLDSLNLGDVRSIRSEVSQQVSVARLPQFEGLDLEDNILFAPQGTERRVTITGVKTGGETAISDFDKAMKAKLGGMQFVTLDTAFPGWSMSGMIESFEGIRESGVPELGEYRLQVVEGDDFLTEDDETTEDLGPEDVWGESGNETTVTDADYQDNIA